VNFLGERSPSGGRDTNPPESRKLRHRYPPIRLQSHHLAWALAGRYLGPGYRGGPEPLVREPATRDGLIAILGVVLNSGEETRYSHPNMPGRDFSQADVDAAIFLTLTTEGKIMEGGEVIRGEREARQIQHLMENNEFCEAVSCNNTAAELAIVLNAVDIHNRMLQLSTGEVGSGTTFGEQAEADVEFCAAIARQRGRSDADEATPEIELGLRIIDYIIDHEDISSASTFRLAMERLDEIRWACAQIGITEDAFGSYIETQRILARYNQMEREGPILPVDSYILQRMKTLTGSIGELDAASQVNAEVDILEHHIRDMPDHIEPEVRAERAVKEMSIALVLALQYTGASDRLDSRLPRMKELAGEDSSKTPIMLALAVISETRGQDPIELPPTMHGTIDPESPLEAILPQEADDRSASIRGLARTIDFHVTEQTPFPLVPRVCRSAIAELRVDYSPERVLERAIGLVDMSLGTNPVDERVNAPVPGALKTNDYEDCLDIFEGNQQLMVHAQFPEYSPSMECIDNAARLMGVTDTWMAPTVLGEWRPGLAYIQTVRGTYLTGSNIINSFDDADIRPEDVEDSERFEFRFERATGRITLIQGWDNPHLRELDGMMVAEPSPILVFPIPHSVITDNELEEVLNREFPQEVEGRENRRNMQIRAVARTLVLYAHLHSEEAESWRTSLSQQLQGHLDTDIPQIYQAAVAQVQENNNVQTVIPLAVALVNQYGDVESPSPTTSAPPPSLAPHEDPENILTRLGNAEQELIATVVGTDQRTAETISQFLRLHPGVRELRIRNAISAMWTEGDFTIDISSMRTARNSVYRECGLSEPTDAERLHATQQIGELSISQRAVIASFCNIRTEQLTGEHVQRFGVWLRADEQELRELWQSENPDANEVTMLEKAISMGKLNFSPDEITLICRIRGKQRSELVEDDYDVRHYTEYLETYRENETIWMHSTRESRMAIWKRGLVSALTAAELCHRARYLQNYTIDENERRMISIAFQLEPSQVTEDHVRIFVTALKSKYESEEPHIYHPPLVHIAQYADIMSLDSLSTTARRHSEFNTLAGLLGCNVSEPDTSIQSLGMTKPKTNGGVPATNDDCFSSAIVNTEEGEVKLHAVFDGMGGHQSGDVASNIARRVFELSAVAGWINSPEDVRKVILLADVAVTAEAISQKTTDNYRAENMMGTTATITMQRGMEFYGVHCGDSPYRILRQGTTIVSSEDHNRAFLFTLGGHQIELPAAQRNVIVSAVGTGTDFIAINNSIDGNFSAVRLHAGDVVMLASDGVTDVVHDEETHFLLELHAGNLLQVMQRHIEIASQRDEARKYSVIIPGSPLKVDGKGSDDKTMLMDRVAEAEQ
jgi:protein phosphatase